MKKLLPFLLFCSFLKLNAQEDLSAGTESNLTFSGYVEAYYSYDTGNPANHERPGIFYSHNRHNEFNVNLAYLKGAYTANRVRANVALMAGTYAQYNLAAEQELLRYVFEANAGVKLSKSKELWLDAGIMPSHIGFESAVGKDSWTLTRSLAAETSPYYEAGARLSYTSASGKWYIAGLWLNGWQRIRRINSNQTPAFGTQLTFKPSDKITLNWSSFVGNEFPGKNQERWRVFHDLYGMFQITGKFGLIAGLDLGAQQTRPKESEYDYWMTPVAIARYAFSDKLAIAARAEYYNDENEVIVSTGSPNGFQTLGLSANVDIMPVNNVMLRLEARTMNSKDPIFREENGGPTQNNYFFTAALAVDF
jgi:hypothetical protein